MKKYFNTALVLLWISAFVLLVWMMMRLPIVSVMTWISGLEFYQWVIWGLINIVIIQVYVYRWLVINTGLDFKTGFIELLLIRQAGQAFSYITPGPQFGGEPLQVFWLWRTGSGSEHKAFLSVALDRVFELWINFAVLLCGIIILMLFSNIDVTVWYYPLIVCLVMITGLLFLGRLIISHDSMVINWLGKSVEQWKHNPKLQSLQLHMGNISTDAHSFFINKPKTFYVTIIISILGWTGMLVELWLVLTFLKIEISMVDYVYLVVAMRLALLLPVPGGIGTMEAAIFWVFTNLGLNTFDVVGMIALIRLRDLVIVLGGMIAFHQLMKRSIRQDSQD